MAKTGLSMAKDVLGMNQKNLKTLKDVHNAYLIMSAGELIMDYWSGMQKALKGFASLNPASKIASLQAMAPLTATKVRGLSEIYAQKMQYGTNEVVDRPKLIMVGEAGPERLQVTPLNPANNINDLGGSGNSVTVNISGNVMSKDFVENELIEEINEAVRRGRVLTQ